jgi:type IV pilus assembly protein PilB
MIKGSKILWSECGNMDLSSIRFKKETLSLLSNDIMRKFQLVPIDIDENQVYIAMSNPKDKESLTKIQSLIDKNIVVISAEIEQIQSLINSIEDNLNIDLMLEQFNKQENNQEVHEQQTNRKSISPPLDSSPVAVISNHILIQAIKMRASDIHIEPFDDYVLIRYRIDGELYDSRRVSIVFYQALCSRLKLLAGIDIAEKRIPQDGKIQFKVKEVSYDLRVSTLPTLYGEKIVIRVLYKNEKQITLEHLGFNLLGRSSISSCMKKNHGIILVTGPTGSGKSTTLYALLKESDVYSKNITTIEDPVEITIDRVNQVNVNIKAGLTFGSGLRSILRQDPNLIMVGEIRDEETAQIATRAAITGHLVVSTLHTNDAASSITRLMDMGVPRYLVADSIIVCVAQRLVRKICEFCKQEYFASTIEKQSLAVETDTKLFKGKGCVFCSYTGYRNRTVVFETMIVDEVIKESINSGKDTEQIKRLSIDKGMVTLGEYGRKLVMLGITTYEEFIKLGNIS